MSEQWKSPRQVQEDIDLYRRKRFEFYMGMAALGICTQEEAISDLRGEMEEANDYSIPTEHDLNTLQEGSNGSKIEA